MKITFKNGSKIESVEAYEGKMGKKVAVYYVSKPTFRDRWLDFVLKIKTILK